MVSRFRHSYIKHLIWKWALNQSILTPIVSYKFIRRIVFHHRYDFYSHCPWVLSNWIKRKPSSFCILLLFFWDKVMLCNSGWPCTHHSPPASAPECWDYRCVPPHLVKNAFFFFLLFFRANLDRRLLLSNLFIIDHCFLSALD